MKGSFWSKLILLAAFLAIWQTVAALQLVHPTILAPPAAVWRALMTDGWQFWKAFQVTVTEIVAAVALAWAGGIAIGAALGSMPIVGRASGPILSSLFAIPLVIWYPFFIVWFGIGSESKIAYAAVSGFFPIVLTTMTSVQLVDRRFIVLGRSIGASRLSIFLRFVVPFSLPGIVSGLRIGTSLIVIGVLVTEMLASTQGLGYLISYHRTLFDTGHVYLGILFALTCAMTVNGALSRLEQSMGRWRDATAA